MRRRMMTNIERDYDMREWKLFKTIDFSSDDSEPEFSGLNYSEFFIIATGLCNIHESTASVLSIDINGNRLAYFDTQNANGSATKNQEIHLKYNGLFWEQSKTRPSNNAEGYRDVYDTVMTPYSHALNIGICTRLKISHRNVIYAMKSGTLKIYAR